MPSGSLLHTCGYPIWREYWPQYGGAPRTYRDNGPDCPFDKDSGITPRITHCPRCGKRLWDYNLSPAPVA